MNRPTTDAGELTPVLPAAAVGNASSAQAAQVREPMPISTHPHTYVIQPGHLDRDDWLRRSNWMPSLDQVGSAARLQLQDAVDPFERGTVSVTMRQGLGLVVVLGLIAGLIPFVADLWLSLRLQTSVPLAQVANSANALVAGYPADSVLGILGHTVQTMAALPPRMPGVLAALLSALGGWLNWPLAWLSSWIVYGIFVFAVARLMGARNNLQAFYAATSFTAVPLVLTGLLPIPWVGPLIAAAGLVLAFVVYFNAVHVATRLDIGRVLLCMLLPLAVAVLLPLVAFGAGWLLTRL